jgi:hypothetical protein
MLKHYLSNIDIEEKTADCLACGRVKIKKKGDKEGLRWRCCNSRNYTKESSQFLLRKYGISSQEFKDLCLSQNNKCKICGVNPGNSKKLSVDHCHSTGKIRGLLCQSCNLAIGLMKDDVGRMEAAIRYILENKIHI